MEMQWEQSCMRSSWVVFLFQHISR